LLSSAVSSSKYKNKKIVVDGHTFDSKREAQHYHELKLREAAKEIRELKLQVPFAIVINHAHICDYICDFAYEEFIPGNRPIWLKRVVDAKGVKTEVYRLKRKLVKAVLQIDIIEV